MATTKTLQIQMTDSLTVEVYGSAAVKVGEQTFYNGREAVRYLRSRILGESEKGTSSDEDKRDMCLAMVGKPIEALEAQLLGLRGVGKARVAGIISRYVKVVNGIVSGK